jgi:two-component sensor histidine kinase
MTQDDQAAIIERLEQDNRRLRSLLEQRDAPGELRHRLRNTMSLLRSIIRKSTESRRDLDSYVAQLEDRVDALARVQAVADAHGSIDLHGMLADELLHYDAKEGEKVRLTGPKVRLEPRAGQILALAFHELAVNAIEHGSLASAAGRVEVVWSHAADAPDAPLTLTWKERDGDSTPVLSRDGFGTEMLLRTLPYELSAHTRVEFEPDGLRFTISLPLTDKVGHVVV